MNIKLNKLISIPKYIHIIAIVAFVVGYFVATVSPVIESLVGSIATSFGFAVGVYAVYIIMGILVIVPDLIFGVFKNFRG